MKRIVIVANTSWFIYNFFRSSILELIKTHSEVYILAPWDDTSDKLIDLGCVYKDLYMDRNGANFSSEIRSIREIYFYFREVKPDCILNFTPKINIYSCVCSKILGIKVINTVSGLGSIFIDKGWKSYIGKILLKVSQPFADHVIFQNIDDMNIYLDNRLINSERCSRVNGIGIDLKRFRPVQSRNDGNVKFILTGRMLESKGVRVFAKSAKIVKQKILDDVDFCDTNVQFSLLGFIDNTHAHSISESELLQFSKEYNVDYLGSTDNVFDIVKDYDCVVLPSFYREGVPQSLIEACAMGKPIITTDNVGCRDTVIDKESGYIIPIKDPHALADAMLKIIKLGHEGRLAFGVKGRQKAVRDFNHLKISKHYIDIINSLILE
ncbi:glycosyltransferase family 4 protein [Vibrio nitrifigilis]|uniref:Glycosyltransferase family 4 protein n=1 Tax=Vibrio nitrifigilis TaxID=2789781 RepID=A0ABS0GFU6_9VIBR|nr:glycosyltransferase family 4 protein [Vibrio nitrifigilis]MBF9001210.1 glycosyltransferase family 4 protein [Vibrio nitrifigilis]